MFFLYLNKRDQKTIRRCDVDAGTCEKKKLAYDIQHMSEGYYNFIKFEAEAATPAEVESRIRIMENVIRFLIVKDGE